MNKFLSFIFLFSFVFSASAQNLNVAVSEQETMGIAQEYIQTTDYCNDYDCLVDNNLTFDDKANAWVIFFSLTTSKGALIGYAVVKVSINGEIHSSYMSDR